VIGIRTVEEVRGMNDRELARVKLPNARNYIDMAGRFLDSLDKLSVTKRLKKKDEEVESLKAQNAEMAQQLAELMALVKGATDPVGAAA
jgi:predicted transcriptional regulator